ncbi:MAG TPA: hypothetical protein VGP94_15685, partial [Tepidisphaeraceae bacterium]|nr:hypothetical protein [Tepidisphaeraceae bacterium]
WVKKKPPMLDYAMPGGPPPIEPPRRPINFAGCLIPLSMLVFGLGALVLSSASAYGRSNRYEIYASGVLIIFVAVAVLVTYFFTRTRK